MSIGFLNKLVLQRLATTSSGRRTLHQPQATTRRNSRLVVGHGGSPGPFGELYWRWAAAKNPAKQSRTDERDRLTTLSVSVMGILQHLFPAKDEAIVPFDNLN